MKIFTQLLLLFFILTSLTIGSNKSTDVDRNSKKIVPGKFVVKYKKSTKFNKTSQSLLANTVSKYNVSKFERIFNSPKNFEVSEKLNLSNVYIMETSVVSEIWNIVDDLNSNPNVEYAEPVYIDKMEAFEPDDPLYSQQQHLPQVKAPEAWDIALGDSTVIIGVIDTGVDWDHEDLENVIWNNTDEIPDNGIDDDNNGYVDDIRGWDFVTGVSGSGDSDADPGEDAEDPDNNPMDYNGHGTHVAGIAAAETNNGIGISSVSAGAHVMPLRIGFQTNDGNGLGYSNWMAEAYIYAADNGADITNLSYGNSGQLIIDAARYAFMNGVLIVESAGNGNATDPGALGTQSFAMSVGALNMNDEKSYYSSFGEYVTVSAPGGELYVDDDTDGILSTVVHPSPFYNDSKYVKFQGTSMAAPLVASVAGLIKAHEPNLSVVDLFTRIVETADNVDGINPLYEGKLGSGRVNVFRALTESVTAEPNFTIIDTEIDDASGNSNGFLDSGEQVILKIKIRNIWQNAEGVTATLTTNNPEKITINSGFTSLGNISGIVDTSNWEKTLNFDITCANGVLPSSIPLNINISASGYNQNLDYYLPVRPKVLFIADFENTNNELYDFSSEYINAFNQNNIPFDYIQHSDNNIDINLLSKYNTVVWGCEWTFPSLDVNDRAVLKQFLGNGGSLFLSGQDVAWDLSENVDNQDILFLNENLKTDYVADNAAKNEIFGIEDDPISDGLSFNFYQEKRDVSQQFPDIISPLEDAKSILKYNTGGTGAISYSGDFRIVFFGFGGFESITDEQTRKILMSRIIDFLDGIEIDHLPLKDSETTTGEYLVDLNATATSESVSSSTLFWSSDSFLSSNEVEMVDLGNGSFQGAIPAQPLGSNLQYYVFVETNSGNYSYTNVYSFNIGNDNEAPTFELLNPYYITSVNLFGPSPYLFTVLMDDNMGIDSSSAQLFYWVNTNELDSTALIVNERNEFNGTFSFQEQLEIGDKVNYYFKVADISANRNVSGSDTLSFMIDTTQIVDDFENGSYLWDLGNGWGISNDSKNNGEFSITDSPFGEYANNSDNALTLKFPFDLSPYKFAELDFFVSHFLEFGKDSLLVEITNDGSNWNMLEGYTAGAIRYRNKIIDISEYTGAGNEKVQFRFRVISDEENVFNGVFIDDISLSVSFDSVVTDLKDDLINIPLTFSLGQNYPNPFNPSTTISFALPKKSDVNIKIYNSLGQLVETLYNGETNAGFHNVVWNANVASGVYYYTIKAGDFVDSKKMVFLK